ncbi:hypothetical protein AN960_16745 [Bacillus sp. FJAT-25509]|nr:hypothetical protein AN960_16745 [Bacillus sp. FJAT-25509]
MNVSQANNKFVYTLPGRGGKVSVPLDENGNFTTQFKVNTAMQPFQVNMYAENMSTVQNYSSYKVVNFVKQGTPYGTAIADKQRVKAGDTVTITLAMNNMTNMKQAVYSFFDTTISQGAQLVSIKPHPTLEGKLNIQTVSMDPDGTGVVMERKITATLTDKATQTGVSGKVPMVDITFKMKDDAPEGYLSFDELNVSYTNTDDTSNSTFGIGVP